MGNRFAKSPRRVSRHAITRRQALRYIGAAAGAASSPLILSACGGSSSSSSSSTLTPEELDIDTVVFVMMENRSFDHYFGSLSLEEGRGVDGLYSGLTNPREDGTLATPFNLDLRCIVDPPHSWRRSRLQFNDGANDGFVKEYTEDVLAAGQPAAAADRVMGYHNRSQLPFFYGLADEFAIFDRWFCSVLGPTWPNRFFLHSAQSNGRMNNDFPEDLVNGFTWPTIYDRLDAAGIPWRTYYSDLSFLLLWPRLSNQPGRLASFEQFVDDARSGTLPPVCHVEPIFFGGAANDDHPPHDFARGQAFLSTVIRAIADGPQWQRSLIVVTYDEHGGFYDHVPPPLVEDERADEGFNQLGVRVPAMLISPYARRGYVSSELHEHSSVPAFIEWLFGLEPLTVRDANANFLIDALDTDRVRRFDPRPLPSLPVIDLNPELTEECIELGQVATSVELSDFADVAPLRAGLDQRADSPRLLRAVHRELIQLRGARVLRV